MSIKLEKPKKQKHQETKNCEEKAHDVDTNASYEDGADGTALKDNQINKKNNSVVISVNKFFEKSEMDELTVREYFAKSLVELVNKTFFL